MEMNATDIKALKEMFENTDDHTIVINNHCYDKRLMRHGGLRWFEDTVGLSEIGFYRNSRAGGIRELADGKPCVQTNFMRSIEVPIIKHGTESDLEVIILLQGHSDCGDYALAYDLTSPFSQPAGKHAAWREKMFQVQHMNKAELFIRGWYTHLSNIKLTFVHIWKNLLDINGENIYFNVLKVS